MIYRSMQFRNAIHNFREKIARAAHGLIWRPRRLLAILLVSSLIIGNMPSSLLYAFAADDNEEDTYVYELDCISFVEAVQEAVSEGNTLDRELDFSGEAADEYEEIFDPNGTLYELNLDTMNLEKDRDREKALDLRVFIRLEGDIRLDDDYTFDGSEEVLFLLQNKGDEEVSAVIYMDERETGLINILPVDEIHVDEDEIKAEAVDIIISGDTNTGINPGPGGISGGGISADEGSSWDAEIYDLYTDGEVSDNVEVYQDEDAEAGIHTGESDEDTPTIDTDTPVNTDIPADSDSSVDDDSSFDDYNQADTDIPADTDISSEKESAEDVSGNDPDNPVHDNENGEESKETDTPEKDASDDNVSDNSVPGDDASDNGAMGHNENEQNSSASAGYGDNDTEKDTGNDSENGTGKDSDKDNASDSDKNSVSNSGSSSGELSASISIHRPNLLTAAIASASNAEKASPSDAEVASPSDAEHFMDGTLENPVKLGKNGAVVYVTTTADMGLGDVVLFASQVLEGSGSLDVYKEDTITNNGNDRDFELQVTNVPTNTPISLYSPNVSLVDSTGASVDLILDGNIYYVSDGETFENGVLVAYLMLDGDKPIKEDEKIYTLIPYDEYGTKCDMSTTGKLVINIPGDFDESGYVVIWQIQTNTLCFLDEQGDYQQQLIEAVEAFQPQTFSISNYKEEETIDFKTLTGGVSDEFYYGSVDPLDLTSCTQGKIVDGALLPLDSNGVPVSDTSLYMVYDRVYSFDVEINDVVNEHTEDNGDTYLWVGDTFYIDQYHAQGYNNLQGYTRSQNTLTNCGIWAQLGRIRESELASGGKEFSDYANISYADMIKVVDMNGYCPAMVKDDAESKAPYGIVGPYKFTDGESAVKTTTKRITGRVGDEFTAYEAFGSDIVYMITNQKLQTDWFNMGSHASDNGMRGWFYWINDYYKLNNYQDEVEYLKIYERENETTGESEIRLEADELGSDGTGELDDIWDITGLYTKRTSAVKEYMLDNNNQSKLTSIGVGFHDNAGWPAHIQLRVNTTVESVINGIVYNGEFTLQYSDQAPKVEFNIAEDAVSDPSAGALKGEVILKRENDLETNSYEFGYYIDPEKAFDPSCVQITVTIRATGTLKGDDGGSIEYKDENPLIYTTTLTEEQLREAYDDCPNNEGYDVAINLADAVRIDNDNYITLTKIWDDYDNTLHSRDDVAWVTVSLEDSADGGDNWSPIVDEYGLKKAFVIRRSEVDESSSSNVWTLNVYASDLGLETYEDWKNRFQFRIAEEQSITGVTEGYEYTYSIGEDNYSLTITNTLTYPITIAGEKIWLDENGNQLDDSLIPDSVIIAVYKDDEFYAMQKIIAEDNWEFKFSGLPQVIGDEDKYIYTVHELDEDGNIVDGGKIMLNGNLYAVGNPTLKPTLDEGQTGQDYEYYTISNTLVTTDITLEKVDGDDTTKTLSDAEFILQKQYTGSSGEETTKYYYCIRNSDGTFTVRWIDDFEDTTILETDSKGTVVIRSLTTGAYILTETRAPDGYNILTKPIIFTITYEDGNFVITIDEDSEDIAEAKDSGNDFIITVKNSPGAKLPNTGGSGTLPFRIAGLLLMGSALYLMYDTLRRKRRWMGS